MKIWSINIEREGEIERVNGATPNKVHENISLWCFGQVSFSLILKTAPGAKLVDVEFSCRLKIFRYVFLSLVLFGSITLTVHISTVYHYHRHRRQCIHSLNISLCGKKLFNCKIVYAFKWAFSESTTQSIHLVWCCCMNKRLSVFFKFVC